MVYEWDEAKNRKNFVKHGLRFEDAERVFSGSCVTFEDDLRLREERLITLGLLAGRKGNSREQEIYQKRLGVD